MAFFSALRIEELMSSSSSSNIVVRLPLVFSTHNDDVVASCSVIREHKREKRDISKTLSSLSTHKKEKKATKKVDVAVSPVV